MKEDAFQSKSLAEIWEMVKTKTKAYDRSHSEKTDSLIMPTTLKKRYVIYLEQELIDYIEKLSRQEHLSRSHVVRYLLKKNLH